MCCRSMQSNAASSCLMRWYSRIHGNSDEKWASLGSSGKTMLLAINWRTRTHAQQLRKWDTWSCRYEHTPVDPHRPVWGCWRGAAGLWSAGCDTAARACQWCSFRCPSAGPWWWKPTPPWQRGCWVMWSSSAAWPHWETLQMSQSRCWSLSAAAGNSGKKKTKTDVESTG